MSFMIYTDANGIEISRKPSTKGRKPIGSTKNADGNWIVPPQSEKVEKVAVNYITINLDGTVTTEPKKQGRTRIGYALATDGEYAGNWVKTVVAEAPIAEVAAV